MQRPLTCVEICAGAGGQALGLAMAGFVHVALVEYEADYCEVLIASGNKSRSSSCPSCLPATEKGGQGTPPANKSTPLYGRPSKS